MIKQLVFALLLTPGMAAAVVCKTVGVDGVVSYTNVPAADCPHKIEIPEAPRNVTPPVSPVPPPPGSNPVPEAQAFQGYTAIAIVQPGPGTTVRSNEGNVPVAIALQPDLQAGHRVVLFLDDVAVSGNFDALAIDISGVERGTHQLRARIVDAAGRTLIESANIGFTLRKASLFERPASVPAQPVPRR